MKRLIMLALVSLSVVAVAAAPSLAASSAKAPKATGDIQFINTGYPASFGPVSAHWVFNALGGPDVKGNVLYEDQFGSYTGKVTAVSVNGQHATFTAEVTSSAYLYANVGDTFTWTVHDLGEPGVGSDYFTYQFAGGSLDLPAITAGNIQVHN